MLLPWRLTATFEVLGGRPRSCIDEDIALLLEELESKDKCCCCCCCVRAATAAAALVADDAVSDEGGGGATKFENVDVP